MKSPKYYLFSGLIAIIAALIIRDQNFPLIYFFLVLLAGVFLKSVFLIKAIKSGNIKQSPALFILLTGVLMVLLSMVFKYGFGFEYFSGFLLFIGIGLKVFSGLYLLVVKYLK
jgi:hypothetical protein